MVSHQNMSMEKQSANDGRCYQMDNLENCMPEVARTMKADQLLCGRGVPCKDVGLEKGSFLKILSC